MQLQLRSAACGPVPDFDSKLQDRVAEAVRAERRVLETCSKCAIQGNKILLKPLFETVVQEYGNEDHFTILTELSNENSPLYADLYNFLISL